MPVSTPTRRTFCTSAALTLLAPPFLNSLSSAQVTSPPPSQPTARPDVAAIDHDRILAAAGKALLAAPAPITSLKSPAESPNDFYSEPPGPSAPSPSAPSPAPSTSPSASPSQAAPASPAQSTSSTPFTAHRDALLILSRQISALTAAFHITRDEKYAAQATLHLRAWFLTPATRLTPDLSHAATIPGDPKPHFEGILDSIPLAEIAQSLAFLARSEALTPADLTALKAWFAAYLKWLTESRVAALARDQKDHHGTSWLFQAAAFARLTQNDAILSDLRHRFKTVTLRAQTVADGVFPHELSTPFPYRNSLFNLDLLGAACLLLSTQFESLWEFELQDGPGLHTVLARHAPFIQNRGAWPYRADLNHFTDLPVRCASLLFAARAYLRPEYATLWRSLNPDPIPALQPTFPISQPLLWIARVTA